MLVDFSFPLPSANRLAKAILRSEESRNEKTLYFAEHHWYTVDYSQFVQESLLDVIEAQEKMFLAHTFTSPDKIMVFSRVLCMIIELSSNDLFRMRGWVWQSREPHPEGATKRGQSDRVAHVPGDDDGDDDDDDYDDDNADDYDDMTE